MKVENVKIELIEWLRKINDASLLNSLLQFKIASEKVDWSDNLTSDQIASLQRGIFDADVNNIISSDVFWKSYGKEI